MVAVYLTSGSGKPPENLGQKPRFSAGKTKGKNRRAGVSSTGKAWGTNPRQATRRSEAELAKLKVANEKAWNSAESQKRRATPKHAILSFKDASALIRRHCADGAYYDHPELLLRRLHRAGFLYWNESHLPDEVILDQRWAIEGIYTVLNRNSRGYGYLKETRGLFTPRDLTDWAWKEAQYSDSEQKLFLGFMESCGVAIKLLEGYETGDQPCFMTPGFLPPANRVRCAPPQDSEICTTPLQNVESHVMICLFQAVAKRQGREFDCWKWGLKCSDDTVAGERRIGETLWAEWTPTSAEGVTGNLKICIRTPEPRRSSYAALVGQALKDTAGVDRNLLGAPGETMILDDQGIPLAALSQADRGEDRPLPLLLRVNISYSGNPPEQDRREWSHLAFPTALRKALESPRRQQRGGYRVLDYQADEATRIASLKALMQKLVKGDVLIVVLSRRYFESPYCMQELFEIARRLEGKSLGTPPEWKAELWNSQQTRVKLYWLPDAANPVRDQAWKDNLKSVWENNSSQFVGQVSVAHFHSQSRAAKAIELVARGQGYWDDERRQPLPELGPCVNWYAASDEPDERQKVIDFFDALIERDPLPPDLLKNTRLLMNFAGQQADELVAMSRQVHAKMINDERSERFVEEIARAQSDAQPPEKVMELFFSWLNLNPASKQLFATQDSALPKGLPEPIVRAWHLVCERTTQAPANFDGFGK